MKHRLLLEPGTDEKRVADFLGELSALARRYSVTIGGCGCCGSPFLVDMQTQNELAQYLRWSQRRQCYEIPDEDWGEVE